MNRKDVAALRMKAASEHVEAAQHELDRAISALEALSWMQPEQAKLGVLRDRIHEAWYRLAPISHARAKACAKAELEREVEAGDEQPHRGCCPGRAVLVREESRRPIDRTPQVAITCEATLRGEADCEGAAFIAKELVDVTTSGHTDRTCRMCGGPMVVSP